MLNNMALARYSTTGSEFKRHLKRCFYLLISSLILIQLIGCTKPHVVRHEVIDALVIRNLTDSPLTDIKLKVTANGTVVGTNMILPQQEYSIGFQANENERAAATLTWTLRNNTYQSAINTIIPEGLEPGVLSRVVIRIKDNGALLSVIEPYAK